MKKPLIYVGGIAGVLLLTWGLILIARGESYELTLVDPIVGLEDAPILLEEFSDFECPACGVTAPIVKEALSNYPTQVKFVYKDFPLSSIHPQARTAAAGVLCAAQQDKFEEFHDAVFENQQVWTEHGGTVKDFMSSLVDTHSLNRDDWESCVNSRDAKKAVDADFAEGRDRGVNSTPTFFLNGVQIETPQSVFQWIQLFDKAIEDKGLVPETKVTEPEESSDSDKE